MSQICWMGSLYILKHAEKNYWEAYQQLKSNNRKLKLKQLNTELKSIDKIVIMHDNFINDDEYTHNSI